MFFLRLTESYICRFIPSRSGCVASAFRENELLKRRDTESWEMPMFRGWEEENEPVLGTRSYQRRGQDVNGGKRWARRARSPALTHYLRQFSQLRPHLGTAGMMGTTLQDRRESYVCKLLDTRPALNGGSIHVYCCQL